MRSFGDFSHGRKVTRGPPVGRLRLRPVQRAERQGQQGSQVPTRPPRGWKPLHPSPAPAGAIPLAGPKAPHWSGEWVPPRLPPSRTGFPRGAGGPASVRGVGAPTASPVPDGAAPRGRSPRTPGGCFSRKHPSKQPPRPPWSAYTPHTVPSPRKE